MNIYTSKIYPTTKTKILLEKSSIQSEYKIVLMVYDDQDLVKSRENGRREKNNGGGGADWEGHQFNRAQSWSTSP